MHKSATKCNKTVGKWCKNKHGASKIIDMLETYQEALGLPGVTGIKQKRSPVLQVRISQSVSLAA
jgi:hypothetical protein